MFAGSNSGFTKLWPVRGAKRPPRRAKVISESKNNQHTEKCTKRGLPGDRRLVSMAPSPCPHVQHGPRRGQQTDGSDDLTMRDENLPMAPPFQQLLQASLGGRIARLSSGREGQPCSGGAPLCELCDLDRGANPSPVSTVQAHLRAAGMHLMRAPAGASCAQAEPLRRPASLCCPQPCASPILRARACAPARTCTHATVVVHRAGRPCADPVRLMTSLRAHPASCPPHTPQSPIA